MVLRVGMVGLPWAMVVVAMVCRPYLRMIDILRRTDWCTGEPHSIDSCSVCLSDPFIVVFGSIFSELFSQYIHYHCCIYRSWLYILGERCRGNSRFSRTCLNNDMNAMLSTEWCRRVWATIGYSPVALNSCHMYKRDIWEERVCLRGIIIAVLYCVAFFIEIWTRRI